MNNILTKDRGFWICAGLTLAIILVYYQAGTHNFIGLDDSLYVVENPNIKAGITLKSVEWAFTTGYCANWHPLTWLSLMPDWQLFDLNAGGFHFTNLIFHIANTLLLFIVLKLMTNAIWSSAFAAALFALHPLHVESVAWVSERKDVLSTFFWLLTMWAYVRYAKKPKIISYILMVIFFVLGLMSKPMAVTLPFVLLLLDYWPLARLGTKRSLTYLLIEKIPLFAMVIISSIITFIVQKKGGAMVSTGESYSLLIRLANASISYMQYIIKMIWPAELAFFYPHPGQNISLLYAVLSAVILLAITIFILRFSKNHRYLFTGWFWYLGTLVPVIGIVQVGGQAMADRYTYITLTGLFIIIAWGLPELLGKWPYRKIVLWASSLIVLSVLSVCSFIQQGYWKNSITLCEHALKVTANNYRAHLDIAAAFSEQGNFEEAIRHNIEVIRLQPYNVEAINRLGTNFYRVGKIDEAVECYKSALEIEPNSVGLLYNLGIALAAKGKIDEAIAHFEEALRIEPSIKLMNILAWFLATSEKAKAHNPQKAIELARRACELTNYSSPQFLDTLATAYAAAGNFGKAIEITQKALELCKSPEQKAVKKELEKRLVLYKEGKPYIEK